MMAKIRELLVDLDQGLERGELTVDPGPLLEALRCDTEHESMEELIILLSDYVRPLHGQLAALVVNNRLYSNIETRKFSSETP